MTHEEKQNAKNGELVFSDEELRLSDRNDSESYRNDDQGNDLSGFGSDSDYDQAVNATKKTDDLPASSSEWFLPARWETTNDRIARFAAENKHALDSLYGENGYRLIQVRMDEMYSWLGRLAYDADNKGASGSIKKFLVKAKAMVPDLKVTVMGRRDGAESIEIYTGSRSKVVGQVESLGHLLVIDDPSLSRPISLGTVTTGYTDGFHRTTQVAAVPDGVQIGEVVTLMRKIQQVHDAVAATTRYIVVVGGDNIELPESSWSTWDEVFLSDDVARRVRDDLKFFLDNKKVFRDAGVPYKRGYLLCGPPGNGKSSIARAIATSMPFKSYMFDFSNTKLGNNDLSNAFRMAADDAPAVFFLEDIDRIFNHDHRDRTHITLDHLLNCLDGIRVNDGLIVVATANNPETLDPAIKSRPGRFDQVVTIENPGTELRHRYVQHLFRKTRVTDEAGLFGWLVDVTDGFSMAFLKEVFVSIVRNAVMTGDLEDGIARIDTEKAQVAAGDVLRQFGVTADKRKKAGFSR